MTIEELRQVVADHIEATHGNPLFIRSLREGGQDDGPWMQGAMAANDWWLSKMAPAPEEVE